MMIGVIVSAISVCITLIGLVVKLGLNMGRAMERLEVLAQQVKDNKTEAEKDFDSLFKFKAETQTTMASISVTLNNINSTMQEIKQDIKELKTK